MSNGSIRFVFLAALASTTGGLLSCAQNVGDIDQTQADKIDVSIFTDGQPWWFLQTVTDVPPSTQFSFVGESSFPPDRIVWDVQNNWLIAYQNYEFVLGAQTYSQTLANGTNGAIPVDQQDYVGTSKSPYFGTPVAAYSILSHFDVERSYNPATGEQTNVVVENTTDRPWYERQYIRVDWSNNGFGGFNFLSSGMGVGEFDPTSVIVSPVAYYVDESQAGNLDAPEIGPNYVGITNKLSYQAEIDTQASQYYGQTIYKCFDFTALVGTGLGDCGPGEVKVKLSFEKIPASHDFAPRVYNDQDELLFGVWQQQRSVYDPQRGYLEPNLAANQFAIMHHIWQKDHYVSDPADPTGATACNPNNIDSNPECVTPLNQRFPKPIVYYVNSDWPAYGDPSHSTMWTHAELLARDYNDDMRGVVAAAHRGGPSLVSDPSACTPSQVANGATGCSAICTSADITAEIANPASGACPYMTVDDWMAGSGISTPDQSKITYGADGTVSYSGTTGLDYLAYPPDTRYLDPSHFGYEGVRADETYVQAPGDANGVATAAGAICTAANITAGLCSVCNPKMQYCMGIGHVPYYVVPRMFMMCHNPVQPRVVTDSNGNVLYDKTDPNNPETYDFSTPGDPSECDPRADAQRTAQPLTPQMGDLRYHMLSWVQQPDDNSPGGIGEPAMDPVTGEIITAHAYIYARAVENLASYGADLVAVMEGWEPVSQFIQGDMAEDYIQAQTNGYAVPGNPAYTGPPVNAPILSSQKLHDMFKPGTTGDQKVRTLNSQIWSHQRDSGQDWTVANWNKVMSQPSVYIPDAHIGRGIDLTQPLNDEEILKGFLPTYGPTAGQPTPVPSAAAATVSFGAEIAPPPVTQWNAQYNATRKAFDDAHVLGDDEIEPVAVRLAQYYDNKFYTTNAQGQKVPSSSNPCTTLWQNPSPSDTGNSTIYDQPGQEGAQYRTCVWEAARQEILGNLWRSYSDHEVGHTFGQYHNFAGSTDALNYFDGYWNIRQTNTMEVDATTAAADPNNAGVILGSIGTPPVSSNPNDPNNGKSDVLAPEWMQAPSYASLAAGMREYQYTSIMDYNAKFNSDFQGLGKYDHATHMFQYGGQVEVFDNTQLPNVPANVDTQNHKHQVDDTLLIPYNRHYTLYPWLINDGVSRSRYGTSMNAPQTPLAEGIQKMIHARRWVNYVDLVGGAGAVSDATAKRNDGMPAAQLSASLLVPYRFCSDIYNLGEADCLWFDEGADAYEQANGLIQSYQLNYLFNNFKRENENFDVFDNMISYQGRLWQRNFNVLVTIFQQYFNDEFVVRYGSQSEDVAGNRQFQCPQPTTPPGQAPDEHVQGYSCGMNQLAAGIDIVDFFTKVMQTPTADTYLQDPIAQVYCPSSYGLCGADGYNPADPLTAAGKNAIPIQLLPGSGAKYDLSQYNLNQYGFEFLWMPTVLGIWIDKIMAISALADPDSYIVGQLNGQPLSFLLSMNDLYYSDVEGSIGGLLSDDPNWAPKVAVYAADPTDPNHPPVTIYRNSRALQSAMSGTGFSTAVNPWCPAGSNFCPSSDPGVVYSQDPTVLQAAGYQIFTLDPGPVYFERLAAAYLGAVWLTAPIDNQEFIQAIHVQIKGDGYETLEPAPLTCADGSTCAMGGPVCTNGDSCTPGAACSDGSLCVPRSFLCGNGATCQGVCQDPTNPSALTCNPTYYAEVYDDQRQVTYYAIKYVPDNGDLSMSVSADPTQYYGTGYQLVQLAAKQKLSGTAVGLGAGEFLDILRGIFYYWSTDYQENGGSAVPPGPI
jgi:hypothetical protein